MTADNNDLGSVISQNSAPLTDSTAPIEAVCRQQALEKDNAQRQRETSL